MCASFSKWQLAVGIFSKQQHADFSVQKLPFVFETKSSETSNEYFVFFKKQEALISSCLKTITAMLTAHGKSNAIAQGRMHALWQYSGLFVSSYLHICLWPLFCVLYYFTPHDD
jgi:hypothetical protein